MGRSILSVVVCAISLFFAGCAFDDQGRGRFADRGGSLKDTHLRADKYKRTNRKYAVKRHVKRRYASAPRKKYHYKSKAKSKIKVVKAPEGVSETDKVVSKKIAKKPEADAAKKMVVAEKTVSSKELPVKENKSDARPAPVETTKSEAPKVTDIEDGSSSEEAYVENLARTADSKDVKVAKEAEGAKEVVLPKEPKVAVKESKAKSDSQTLAMHIQTPDNHKPKTREFNAGIVVEDAAPYTVVKVYYATDRNLSGKKAPKKVYGIRRGAISYGICEISIPKSHKIGEIEAPSIWRMEFRENQEKHVVLKSVHRKKKSVFFDEVKKNIALSRGKNAFVFVHGYNIEFHEAALRTAQMAHDLKFDGAPIFYSWPSKGTYKDYTRDEANIQWTQSNLKRFMKDFVQRSKAENIYLIAHSMGARALTGAITELANEMPSIRRRIKEVMLAAPDIDAEVFKRDIAPKLVKASRNITLYASADDKALRVSRTIHGQPRAGDAGDSLVVVKGVDTIDATGIDTSLFGHNYFAEAPSIISDILAIMHYGRRPKDRTGLIPVLASEGQYWAFRRNNSINVNGTVVPDDEIIEMKH